MDQVTIVPVVDGESVDDGFPAPVDNRKLRKMGMSTGGDEDKNPFLDKIDPMSFMMLMGSIRNQLETVTRTLSEDRMAAASYRTDQRTSMLRISEAVAEMAGEVRDHGRDIAEMKPEIKHMREWQAGVDGATKFAGVVGKMAHVISVAIGGFLMWLLEHMNIMNALPRPPLH